MKNWKTTIAGALLIVAGGVLIYIGKAVEGSALIVTGLGLVAAKDSNVTGGTVQQ